MNIILSRKGFDSQYGGYPSPILPDGRLISLPIPGNDGICYSDLYLDFDDFRSYYDLMEKLFEQKHKKQIRDKNGWFALEKSTQCHLDPDLYGSVIERKEHWKPLFGQVDVAQRHLNRRVEKGDIFLFFGTFRKTEYEGKMLTFVPKEPAIHIIFGYLQIGEEKEIKSDTNIPSWIAYHPHIASSGLREKKINTVYVARETLSWDSELSGAGPFRYHKDLVLTKKGKSKSRWELPLCFKKVEISYHSKRSWKNEDYFQSAARGQEFVIQSNEEIEDWVKELISKVSN